MTKRARWSVHSLFSLLSRLFLAFVGYVYRDSIIYKWNILILFVLLCASLFYLFERTNQWEYSDTHSRWMLKRDEKGENDTMHRLTLVRSISFLVSSVFVTWLAALSALNFMSMRICDLLLRRIKCLHCVLYCCELWLRARNQNTKGCNIYLFNIDEIDRNIASKQSEKCFVRLRHLLMWNV